MKHVKKSVYKLASSVLPTSYGNFKIIVYRGVEDKAEHVVLVKGTKLKEALVRIHSRCMTGDVFSSLKCDCHDQLARALSEIGKRGGVLIYLNQEGRGIGLVNKIKAYFLQDQGLDTIEANESLGFAADTRDYQVAAEILRDLKISRISLLTNNPDKVNQLKNFGIKVLMRIPIEITPNRVNKTYLKIKKEKMGHRLSLV